MKKFFGHLTQYFYFYSIVVSGVIILALFGSMKVKNYVESVTGVEAGFEAMEDESETIETAETENVVETTEMTPEENVVTTTNEESVAEPALEETSPETDGEVVAEETNTASDAVESDNAETVAETETPAVDGENADLAEGEMAETEPAANGVEYIYYDPIAVNSKYYSDPGCIALTSTYEYTTVEDDYFNDACFIGDSRMMGIFDYANLRQADFYCNNGYCTYLWSKEKPVNHQNSGKKVVLDDALSSKTYGKIYIMIGLNDCGYGNIDNFSERLSAMLDMIKEKQPDAIIFLMGNLHMSQEKSDGDAVYNNLDLNAHNVAVAAFADGDKIFYLDFNPEFTDENGYLRSEETFDGVHLYADGYVRCAQFLKEHGVVK
ncbi:MAG: hypothetical protein K5659_06505 [Lachnospiraceae bacterium]|nr:hypothetical protein [Lachnospiraceae bacterium]